MKAKDYLPKGVYTATLTPMKADLRVDHDLLHMHCRWLLKQGSHGIALLGTTGEANSFSVGERIDILNRLVDRGIEPECLIVGTGCCSLPDTVQLTRHAMSHGVGGILLLPPFYYKQVRQEGIRMYIDMLIDHLPTERLHIYLYHFPRMSGISFELELLKSLYTDYPGIVVGMKDSSGDIGRMRSIQEELPGFHVFAGTEKHLLEALEFGGYGCISATANVTVNLCREVFDLWEAGREVTEKNRELTAARERFEGLPFTGALKSYLAQTTSNPVWQNVRPPNELVREELVAHIARDFETMILKE